MIGPGGKTIRGIIEATRVKIDVDDTGRVNVASSDEEGLKRALAMINDLTAVPEIGKTYLGKVVRLAEFGAFVEIFPGTDGLLHVSEIAEHRVKEVKDELREGDQVLVKVLGIEGNRIKLSRKALLREQREKLGLPEPPGGGRSGRRRDAGSAGAAAQSQPQWSVSRLECQHHHHRGRRRFRRRETRRGRGRAELQSRGRHPRDAVPAEVRRQAARPGPVAPQDSGRRRHRSRGSVGHPGRCWFRRLRGGVETWGAAVTAGNQWSGLNQP